jgi:hypothetical protein
MEGSLTGFTLREIFEMLAAMKKTGTLDVVSGNDEEGRACFRDGQLYWAETFSDDEEETNGSARVKERIEDAVMEIFDWESDAYRFNAGETIEKGGKTALKVDAVLADVTKRQAEWAEIRKEIPSMKAKIGLIAKIESESVSLTSDQWEVIALISRCSIVDDLRAELKCGPLTVCRTLYEMSKMGLLRCLGEVEEAEPPAAKPKSNPESEAVGKKYIRKSLLIDEATSDAMPAEWSSYYQLLDSRKAAIKTRSNRKVTEH